MDKFDTGNVEADKYFAALNAADEGIGQIIAKLKENGELENTLIFSYLIMVQLMNPPCP